MQNQCEKCGVDAAPPRQFLVSQSLNPLLVHLDNTRCGFVLPVVEPLRERVSAARVIVSIAISIDPQFLPPSVNQCRDYAIRHDCEPNGPPLGPRTAKEGQNSLVKGQEKRAGRKGCQQVFAPRPTRRISLSPRQSPSPTTSTPTPRAQSRSLCPFRQILLRYFLPISRLPLRRSYSPRLSSSGSSTDFPATDLEIYKPPSLVLFRAILRKLPYITSSTSCFLGSSRATILRTAASFLHPTFHTAGIASLVRQPLPIYPQIWPSDAPSARVCRNTQP